MISQSTDRRPSYGLAILLSLYVLLTIGFSQVVPFNKGPDEETNLAYINFIIEHGRLPINYEERTEVGKDANWPALYQLMVAALSYPAGATPTESPTIKVWWDSFRYHALDTGEDEPFYLRTADQLPPYQGQFLVWQIGRWLSIALGLLTLLLLYRVILELIPNRWVALFGVSLLAFWPTFTFMSSVLNEDTLMTLLTTLYLWLLILWVKQPQRWWLGWLLGLILGLSITIKYTTIVLPLEVVIVVIYLSVRHGYGWWWAIRQTITIGLATIIGASWWFGWNFWYLNTIEEHGLIVGLLSPIFTGGPDVTLARLGYFFSQGEIGMASLPPERELGSLTEWLTQMWLSFWGVSAGGVIAWSPWIYLLPTLLVATALFGLGRLWRQDSATRLWIWLLSLHIGLFVILPLLRFGLSRRIGETAQGRHVLIPAVAAVIILLIWGLSSALNSRRARPIFGVILLIFLAWTVAHWHLLATFSPPPLPLQTAPFISESPPLTFDDTFALVDYDLTPQPQESALIVNLTWQLRQPVRASYRLGLTVLDEQQQAVSHWEGYNGRGRVPTLAWEVGDTVFDRLRLPLPDLSAGGYALHLRWHSPTGAPPVTATHTLPLTLTEPSAPIAKTPIDGMTYTVWDDHHPATLTEAWLQPPTAHRYPSSITILTEQVSELQLVDEANRHWSPTRQTTHDGTMLSSFVIGPRWASGDYRLRLVSPQGEVTLTEPRVSVENWWPREFASPESIAQPSEANFANQIYYLGYTLPQTTVRAGEAFPVTVYWQAPSDKAPQADFIQFNNLLDEAGRQWGGYDRQPLEYYSTLLWAAGEVVVDGYAVPVAADAPPGRYYLDVGYYIIVGESGVNLPLVREGQMSEISTVTIGPIEVVE